MTAVLARLDPDVPLRYTVCHTNNHQTLIALAFICHQVNVYEQKFKNPPHRFDKWEIKVNEYKANVEQGKKVGREPQKPRCVVHLPILILWYDRNT
jgi:hypothetical protein